MRFTSILLGLTSVLAIGLSGSAMAKTPVDTSGDGEPGFRALYKELVETNTAHSTGSCTLAAQRMAARLKAVGYTDADIHMFAPDEAPKDGGLVAVFHGTGSSQKAILLMAHLDVVEAKASDWARDPFTLVEDGGYFYGRGTTDDKAMAAIFTDLMVRFKTEGYKPKRDIKLMLTCGEETSTAFNGANWLAQNHKDWIDAAFAINEGGAGELDAQGKPVSFDIEAGEKVYQDFILTTTNPGGHSSRPRPDNAIYEMAHALDKIAAYEFPVMLNDASRGYFTEMAKIKAKEPDASDVAKAMADIVADPHNAAASAVLAQNPMWHSVLRTTCVATLLNGGHAPNALPQSVTANINCRIFPGVSVDAVKTALVTAIDDPGVAVATNGHTSPATPAPPLGANILGPIKTAASAVYPGVPVLPTMQTWATDGIYISAVGIPAYGLNGYFIDPDNGNMHGLNERVGVKSLMDGRRFHYKLVKLFADQK